MKFVGFVSNVKLSTKLIAFFVLQRSFRHCPQAAVFAGCKSTMFVQHHVKHTQFM